MANDRATEIDAERLITELMEQYGDMLCRLCCVMLRDRELAQDAVQETFLKAYRALPAFRGECSEKTWLTRIAINTCRSMLRSGWLRHIDLRKPVDELTPNACGAADELDVLGEAIMALPLKYRQVIMLYYYQQLTTAEIAQALRIPMATVSTRLRRARAQLKALMEGGI